MKPLSLVLVAVMVVAAPARSQEEAAPSGDAVAAPTTARIIGTIPDGTPPPQQSPKPEYVVAAGDVLNATTTSMPGGGSITIRQIKPIALPPPPAPVELTASRQDTQFNARLADYREAHPPVGTTTLGATVYRSKDSPPRTLLRYWPERGGVAITMWSSADFSLIAGGIHSFVDTAGQSHSLIMGWGTVDIDRLSELRTAKGLKFNEPDIPDFPDGSATFQVMGDQPPAGDLLAIQSLHDLYNKEHARLQTAYEGRERARIEREAFLKANPPQPKNIVLNYWHTEKPVSKEKEAAQ